MRFVSLRCDKCDIVIIVFVFLSLFGIYCQIWYILKYDNPTKYKNDNFILRSKELHPDHFSKLTHHLYICIPLSMCNLYSKEVGRDATFFTQAGSDDTVWHRSMFVPVVAAAVHQHVWMY